MSDDAKSFWQAVALVEERQAARKARWQAAFDALPAPGSEAAQAAGCLCSPSWTDGGCPVHGGAFWSRLAGSEIPIRAECPTPHCGWVGYRHPDAEGRWHCPLCRVVFVFSEPPVSEPPDPEGRRRTLAEMEQAISDPRPEDDAPEAMRVLGVLAREKGWAEDDIADWLGRYYRYRRLRA